MLRQPGIPANESNPGKPETCFCIPKGESPVIFFECGPEGLGVVVSHGMHDLAYIVTRAFQLTAGTKIDTCLAAIQVELFFGLFFTCQVLNKTRLFDWRKQPLRLPMYTPVFSKYATIFGKKNVSHSTRQKTIRITDKIV